MPPNLVIWSIQVEIYKPEAEEISKLNIVILSYLMKNFCIWLELKKILAFVDSRIIIIVFFFKKEIHYQRQDE